MDKLLEQLSEYELLNNLIPGTIFCFLLEWHTGLQIQGDNAITNIIAFYFAGLVVGRFGSLFIEFPLSKLGLIKFSDYTNYIAATKADSRLESISSKNNLYRSLVATFFLYGLLLLIEHSITECPTAHPGLEIFTTSTLFLLFFISYIKQTNYILKRVNANIKNNEKEL